MLENHETPSDKIQKIDSKIQKMKYFLDNNSKDPAKQFDQYLENYLPTLSVAERVKLLTYLMDELDNMEIVLQNSFNESVANREKYKTNSQILGLEGEDERQILQLTLEKFQKIISQHTSANNQSINHRPRRNDD